ncbi:hypothetical protein NPIL_388991 [Nephila pilipes]|uniref:Uncharacterized protein n=1 Tax=Nephila pilipes TaxID=299642 RepID=A0A8X6QU54_NEPPI|nr:hypothetical protein NPIL_388991 [Nephila pilipes]
MELTTTPTSSPASSPIPIPQGESPCLTRRKFAMEMEVLNLKIISQKSPLGNIQRYPQYEETQLFQIEQNELTILEAKRDQMVSAFQSIDPCEIIGCPHHSHINLTPRQIQLIVCLHVLAYVLLLWITLMDSDCSDEDMSSSVNEVSAILSRIRDFDVSNVDNEIDNLIHFDKCLEISENLDKFIEDINQFNLTNVDYLNKKALILELALKCSKRLNVLNHHELQQHLNHKDHELHLLKERLTAIENKLITAAEIQPINPTPKTNKKKEIKSLLSNSRGKKQN